MTGNVAYNILPADFIREIRRPVFILIMSDRKRIRVSVTAVFPGRSIASQGLIQTACGADFAPQASHSWSGR
jgi:hypothetical protein